MDHIYEIMEMRRKEKIAKRRAEAKERKRKLREERKA